MPQPTCTTCNAAIEAGDISWPGERRGDVLCQNCWELDCDRGWWEMVEVICGPTPEPPEEAAS